VSDIEGSAFLAMPKIGFVSVFFRQDGEIIGRAPQKIRRIG
jgi:hypothetical protein